MWQRFCESVNPYEETREEKPYVTAEEDRLLHVCQTNKQTKNTAQQKMTVSVEAL